MQSAPRPYFDEEAEAGIQGFWPLDPCCPSSGGKSSHGIVGLDPGYFVDPDLLKGIGIDFLIFLSSLLCLVVDL